MLCPSASNSLNKWGYQPWSLWWFQVNHQPSQGWIWGLSWRPHILSSCSHSVGNTFEGFYISHVSRFQNTKVYALAALAATLALPADTSYYLTVATRHLFCPKYGLEVSEAHTTSTNIELRDWRFPIIDTAYYPMTPRKQWLFDEGLLDFTMMHW